MWVRWAWLAAALAVVLQACGAVGLEGPVSTLCVMVSAVVLLLAPLFWPGSDATGRTGLWRVIVWCGAVTALAVVAMFALAPRGLPVAGLAGLCVVLLLQLLAVHLLITRLAVRVQAAGQGFVVLLLALLAALPLWLGPAAQSLPTAADTAVDLLLAASPLVHLAVAAGNDLLRNGWFYEHSNLAGLPFSYPDAVTVGLAYAVVCVVLSVPGLRPVPGGAGAPFPERS